MKLLWWQGPNEHCEDAIKAVVDSQTSHLSGKLRANTRYVYRKALKSCAEQFSELSMYNGALKSQFVADSSLKYFRDKDVRLAATLISRHRCRERFKPVPSLKKAEAYSQQILNFDNQKEKIRLVLIPKSSGEFRKTYAFGPIRYAQQLILVWFLSALIKPSHADFSLPGNKSFHGMASAAGKVVFSGYSYFAVADIKSAFPSVRPLHLKQLIKLHSKLVRYVAFPILPSDVEASSSYTSTTSGTPGAPQRELPQGGVHSSFILSCLIDGAFAMIDGDIQKMCFADNLAIGARTVEEAECALQKLEKVLSSNPAGGFFIHQKEIRDGLQHGGAGETINGVYYGNAINLPGYRVSVDQFTGETRLRANEKAHGKLWKHIREKHNYWLALDPEDAEIEAKNAYRSFSNHFPLWNFNELALDAFLSKFGARRLDAMG